MAGRIAGITVELGANARPLQTALRGIDTQLRTMKSGLRDVDRLLKFNPASTTLLTQKQTMLRTAIEQTKQRLSTLKQAMAEMKANGVDETSEDYQRLQREIVATENELKRLQKEYMSVASVAGAKLQAVGQKMKEVGQKITEVGQSVTRNLTVPLAAVGAAAIKSFKDVDKGMDAIVAKTGATGQALESMKDSAKRLATEIPTDFQTAGDAVGQVNTRFKLTGAELEDVAGKFVKFAKLNNTDVTTSINSVQSAMSAFGLSSKDAGDFLDTLNAVAQDTGADVNKLADSMVTNAAALKDMGYSASDAATFLGQLSVNGIDTNQAMAGLKRAFAESAAEGKPLKDKLAELQDTMKNASTDSEAYAAALDLFGKRAGPALAAAIRDGRLSLDQLGTSLKDNAGNLETTFKNTLDPIDEFKMALNQAKVAGGELGSAVLQRITPLLGKLKDALSKAAAGFKSLTPAQQDAIVKFGLIAAAVGPVMVVIGKLVGVVGTLVSGIGKAMNNVSGLSYTLGVSLGPIIAAAAALGALGIAAYSSYNSHKQLIEQQHSLTEAQKQTVDALNKTTEAYNQSAEAAAQQNETIAAQFNNARQLKEEYNSLVDANGKIAESDQARANVILGDLAKAMGMEKSEVQALIGANGKLTNSIDKVIAKKEAQAYLDANYDSYVEAIKLQTSSNKELAGALQTVNSAEQGVATAEANLLSAQNALNNARQIGAHNTAQLAQKVKDAKIALDTEKAGLAEAQAAVDKHAQASAEAANTIASYSNLQEAVQTGNINKINSALSTYQNSLKTATTATQQELQKQVETTQADYEAIKAAYDSGQAGITKAMVDAAARRAQAAKDEAAKVGGSAKTEGDAITNSIGTASKNAAGDFKKISNSASTEMSKASKAVSDSASNIKKTFPIDLGNLFKGTVAKIATTVKEKANGGKTVTPDIKYIKFAKAYDNPWLFTSPTALVGDRGSYAGGEMIYSRDKLMNDIRQAANPITANQLYDIVLSAIDHADMRVNISGREFGRIVREV